MKTNYTKLFLKEIFKYKKNSLTIIFLSIVSVTFFTSIPYIIGLAIEEAKSEVINFEQIYLYIMLILSFTIIFSILNFFILIIATSTCYDVVVDLRLKLFKKLHSYPMAYFDNLHKGKVNSLLINDLQLVTEGLSSILRLLIPNILTIIFSVVMMILLNSLIAAIIIVISILSLLLTRFLSHKAYHSIEKSLKMTAKYNIYTTHMLSNTNIVTSFNYQDASIKEATKLSEELSAVRAHAMFFTSLNGPASRFINNITYVLVGLIGGLTFINNPDAISFAVITSLLFYTNMFSKPLSELAQLQTQTVSCLVASKRIYQFLENSDSIDIDNSNDLTINNGDINFVDVNFSYDKNVELIKNFNLDVKAASKIAIVGPTGAGKTTLVNLLMRFYELNSGKILIDNQDISLHSKNSLRSHIGMVLQDTWLKDATIKENLMYGNDNISFEAIIDICKTLKIDDFIRNLPDSYDTKINEASYFISQGQKQLISIARTMTTDCKILILDEATSNIDTRTEVLIKQALDILMKNKTSFIIAHRLKTIINADQILVLDKGNIVEIGTHDNLLSKKSFYYNLFNSQFKEH